MENSKSSRRRHGCADTIARSIHHHEIPSVKKTFLGLRGAPMLFGLLILLSSSLAEVEVDGVIPTSDQDEKGSSTSSSFLESLWDKLTQKSSKQQQKETAQDDTPHKHGRRRLLFEHALESHYSQYLPLPLLREKVHQEEANDFIMESDAGCLWYNEGGTSYWHYRLCPGKNLKQLHIVLSKDEWIPETTIHLGKYEGQNNGEERTESKGLLRLVSGEVQLYGGGDKCDPGNGMTKRRRSIVTKSAECSGGRRRITKVEEPFACQYIVHLCEPQEASDANVKPDPGPQKSTNESENVDRTDTNKEAIVEDSNSEERSQHDQEMIDNVREVLHQYLADGTRGNYDKTTPLHISYPPFPPSRLDSNIKLVKEMFQHAYDSYMYNAFPAAEVKPLTCKPGTFDLVRLPALTLVDTLDTLVVMGNYTEFARGVERVRELHLDEQGLFAVNQNVSVFETNIRVLGGLLSAHQLAEAFLPEKVLYIDVFGENGNVLIGLQKHEVFEGTCPAHQAKATCEPAFAEYSDLTVNFDFQSASGREQCTTNDTKKEARRKEQPIFWEYDGILLELASDLGQRLLPAFETKTGIPYGTVNLLHGIPPGETTIASLAGGGTLTLEMELLSRMTGDEDFGKAAKLASRALWMRRSPKLNLLGKHIDVNRGEWTETLSGIGSNSDSFYEYLIKHYILFPEDDDFWTMLVAVYNGLHNDTRLGEWYADVDMNLGVRTGGGRRVFESLMAFYPGMQVLLGELSPAARTLNSFFIVREYLGFLPERFNYGHWQVDGSGAGRHPLRPELLESCYFLHRATSGLSGMPQNNRSATTGWLWAADFSLHALQDLTLAKCGYASVKDLSPTTTGVFPRDATQQRRIRLVNEMPSFFLSETLKYLYLIFDEENILHTDAEREWVFTTEAHPIHHVSVFEKSAKKEQEWLEETKKRLEKRLKDRLKRKQEAEDFQSLVVESSLNKDEQEKWTEKSPSSLYTDHLKETEIDTAKRRKERNRMDIKPSSLKIEKQPFLGPLYPSRGFMEADEDNFANLSFKHHGLGNGASLMKSCPNFHNSGLLWVRALNGGALDYTEVYISSASNDVQAESESWAMSALESAAQFGNGLYLGVPEDPVPTCKLDLDDTESKDSEKPAPPKNVERVDAGVMGEFEIGFFEGGTGFTAKRVGSDEIVTATLYSDKDQSDTNDFIMVYLQTPTSQSIERHQYGSTQQGPAAWRSSWRSIFRREGRGKRNKEFNRSVVFTNTVSKTFVCTVQVLKEIYTKNPLSDETSVEEIMVAEYPCAPALFGPTDIRRLSETGGLQVEGAIWLPSSDDPNGCVETTREDFKAEEKIEEDDDDEFVHAATLQLLHRGECTFEDKAMNQKHADGVIVINSGNEEFFLMSSGSDDKSVLSPPTVLIAGVDATDMQRLLDDYWASGEDDDENIALFARIDISPQTAELENGKVVSRDGEIGWPLLLSNANQIQIFAPSGWGVQAVNTGTLLKSSENNWQLFLLSHNVS